MNKVRFIHLSNIIPVSFMLSEVGDPELGSEAIETLSLKEHTPPPLVRLEHTESVDSDMGSADEGVRPLAVDDIVEKVRSATKQGHLNTNNITPLPCLICSSQAMLPSWLIS